MAASCEKCWRDAGGVAETYENLLKERADNPCSPEERAGPYAGVCPQCHRKTLHPYAGCCMAGCELEELT